jgi:hypothetical protein
VLRSEVNIGDPQSPVMCFFVHLPATLCE